MNFADLLLPWYFAHRRSLPWRDHPDPYAVWVSEIMLQQTRVEAVLPYYERWMARFPTVASVAHADVQEVLQLWEGLGYYSRARNLHRAACIVLDRHAGRLPEQPDLLRKLPGIGRYTAGAIASLAYQRDEPLVDGNVRRVLARLFDLAEPADTSAGQRRLWQLARENLPPGRARDYNQALMELGALVCTPGQPQCSACPLQALCAAFSAGTQSARPILKPKQKVPHYTVTAAVIRRDALVLITQRPDGGLLGGLWEFPGGKTEPGEDLPACLQREIHEELGVAVAVGEPLGVYRHAYTHFKVTLHAFGCRLQPEDQSPAEIGVAALRWVRPADLTLYPMGKIDRQIAAVVQQAEGSDHG